MYQRMMITVYMIIVHLLTFSNFTLIVKLTLFLHYADCLTCNFLFPFFNVIGWCCLSDPTYSRGTVNIDVLHC